MLGGYAWPSGGLILVAFATSEAYSPDDGLGVIVDAAAFLFSAVRS